MKNMYAPSSKLFDWIFVTTAGIWSAGAYVDGWAHTHLSEELETFFTPWHAVFYAGILLTGFVLVTFLYKNYRKGYLLRYALPKEYFFSLAGVILASVSGILDMLWHQIFGIEVGVEALLSPTHIMLAIGGVIAVAGPLHSVWYRPREHAIHDIPTVLSATYFMAVTTFMLQFLHPFNFPWMAESFISRNVINLNFAAALGVANIIVFTAVFIGIILSTIKHWKFPFGSFTIMLGLNALAITLMHGEYYSFILVGLIGGLLIDLLYQSFFRREWIKMHHLHIFCFLAPIILFSCYFIDLFLTDRIVWSTHMWTGAIFISGIVGYLLSFLVIPPKDWEYKIAPSLS